MTKVTRDQSQELRNQNMSKLAILLYSVAYICFFGSFIALKSQHDPISLHDEKFTFTPHKFYIVNVADARINQNLVAILIEKGQKSPITVDLKDGAVDGIKNFLNHNLHRDTTLRPVLLTIKDFKITETRSPNGMVSGEVKVSFSFSSQLSYQNKNLVNFHNDIHYKRLMNKPINVEAKLKGEIMDGLSYFNNWINNQKNY